MCGNTAHSASTDEELDFLWSEQVFERRLVGDHVEASPERFKLLLHTFVQHVLCILRHKLLHKHTPTETVNIRCPNSDAHLNMYQSGSL